MLLGVIFLLNVAILKELFTYLFIFERVSERAGKGQRERIPNRLRAVNAEPDGGLDFTNREIVA